MSLYDDEDLPMSSTAAAPGWSQGVKLLQTQLQLKKATHAATAKKEPAAAQKPKQSVLPPVKDFKKARKDVESAESGKSSFSPAAVVSSKRRQTVVIMREHFSPSSTGEWTVCCRWTSR